MVLLQALCQFSVLFSCQENNRLLDTKPRSATPAIPAGRMSASFDRLRLRVDIQLESIAGSFLPKAEIQDSEPTVESRQQLTIVDIADGPLKFHGSG